MKDLSYISQTPIINTLIKHVHRRNFKQAENEMLNLVEAVLENEKMSKETKTQMILEVHAVYTQFNDHYTAYIRAIGGDLKKEHNELTSDDHENYFIANSSDVSDMDDLLYELLNYLMDSMDSSQDEVQEHISYYRRQYA